MPGPRVRSRRGEPEFAAPAATSSKSVDVDFITGVTVVDMRGGERIPGRRGTALSAVGELLLLNPDGTLTMRNELNDETAYQQLTNPQNETSAAEAGGPGPMVAPGLPPKSPLDEAIGWRSPAKKKTAKPK